MEKLADKTPEDCGGLLDEFVLSSGANAMLVGPDGRLVDTGAQLTVQTVYEDGDMIVTTAEGDTAVSYGTTAVESEDAMTITTSEQATIAAECALLDKKRTIPSMLRPGSRQKIWPCGRWYRWLPGFCWRCWPFPCCVHFSTPAISPGHCAYERNCREDGAAGFPMVLRRDPAG